jgi:hypothetical protein
MKVIKAISVILLPFFVACESDEKKFVRAERECYQKNSMDQLDGSLFGYSYDDVDSVSIKIQRGGKIIADYRDALPKKYFDSLRHQRYYTIKKNILLTDTLMVKTANEPTKKIYGFSYAVKPHFTMMNRDFGCEFSSFVIDGELVNESTLSLVNKSAK